MLSNTAGQGVDFNKSRNCFNMKEIDASIEPMVKDLSKLQPAGLKAKLTLLATLFMLFYVSWRLTLFSLGCLALVAVLRFFCLRRDDARTEAINSKKQSLYACTI